jgi:tetratricopeptide (TPR) repeat protein
MDVGNSKKAIKDLLQAQRVCKSPAYSEMLNAQLAWARGDNQLALERITAALALDPKDPRYYHFRAYLRANVDSDDPGIRHEQEMADYNFILDNIPYKRKFIIENNLGYVYYEAGDYNMALKHFTNSIDACKHHVQAYYNRAVAYGDQVCNSNLTELINKLLSLLTMSTSQDMFDKAIAECETIISMNPRSYDAYSLYGWCLLTTGKYVEALKHYRQVAEAPDSIPNGSVCQVYLGLLTALGMSSHCRKWDEIEFA